VDKEHAVEERDAAEKSENVPNIEIMRVTMD
jgi:hypothetical protein